MVHFLEGFVGAPILVLWMFVRCINGVCGGMVIPVVLLVFVGYRFIL